MLRKPNQTKETQTYEDVRIEELSEIIEYAKINNFGVNISTIMNSYYENFQRYDFYLYDVILTRNLENN